MRDYKLPDAPRIREDRRQIIVGEGVDVVAFRKNPTPRLTVASAVDTFLSCVRSIAHQPAQKYERLQDLAHRVASALYDTRRPEWGADADESIRKIQAEFKIAYTPIQPEEALRVMLQAIWERKVFSPDGEKIPYPKVSELWDAVIEGKRLPPGKLETHRIPYANSYKPQVTERSRRFIAELYTLTEER